LPCHRVARLACAHQQSADPRAGSAALPWFGRQFPCLRPVR